MSNASTFMFHTNLTQIPPTPGLTPSWLLQIFETSRKYELSIRLSKLRMKRAKKYFSFFFLLSFLFVAILILLDTHMHGAHMWVNKLFWLSIQLFLKMKESRRDNDERGGGKKENFLTFSLPARPEKDSGRKFLKSLNFENFSDFFLKLSPGAFLTSSTEFLLSYSSLPLAFPHPISLKSNIMKITSNLHS